MRIMWNVVAGTEEDDFTYWHNLSKQPARANLIRRLEHILLEFLGLLKQKGITYVDYRMFPFDTKTVIILFGGYENNKERYFSISLEGFDLNRYGKLYVGEARVTTWVGRPDYRVFKEEEKFGRKGETHGEIVESNIQVESLDELISMLQGIYNRIKNQYTDLPDISRRVKQR
ncbi:MAG: hypothetical protein QXQ48_09125 [Nitrososphaerota archaeon]